MTISKRFTLFFILIFSCGLLASCTPASVSPVAQMNFPRPTRPAVPTYIAPSNFAETTSNNLLLSILQDEAARNTHVNSRFLLTDRDASTALFDQMVDQQLGLLSDETVAEMGNQLGARYAMTFVATTSVVDENPLASLRYQNTFLNQVNSFMDIVQPNFVKATINLRLTDIESGIVVATGSGIGARAGGILSGVPFQDSLRDASVNALNDLITNYVARGL